MARVSLLCGPPGSERAAEIAARMRRGWGRSVLIVPTRRLVERRLDELILDAGLPGAWGRPVQTFLDFALWLLGNRGLSSVSDPQPASEISGSALLLMNAIERRLVLERTVRRLHTEGRLGVLSADAITPGFLTHLLRTITQLKQAAVEPAEFRQRIARRLQKSWLDEVVASAYEGYQAALVESGRYDVVGVFWQAAVACAHERPAPLETVRALVLDGFDDFTPSEFRLLKALEPHLDELVFGLSYDPDDPSGRDVYALPVETAETIRRHFAVGEERHFRAASPTTFSEFAASRVFWRDRPNIPEGLRPNLHLVACAGAVHEVETIVRRVKALLVKEGALPRQIAVVYRSLRSAAGMLRSVFAEFGIPVCVEERPRLPESAVANFLLGVCDAAFSWRRESVVDVLTSPWFAADAGSAECIGAISTLTNLARIISGYDEWSVRLKHLQDRLRRCEDDEAADLCRRMPCAQEAMTLLLARLELLREVSERLRAATDAARFFRALDDLVDTFGVQDAIRQTEVVEIREFELAALQAFRSLLGRLSAWCQGQAAEGINADWLRLLRDAVEETSVGIPEPRHGVSCLDVESLRDLRFDYVLYGGVNQGEVPSGSPGNAIYSDADMQDLQAVGIRMEGALKHTSRELLLFHHVLAAARKELWITWRTLSSDGRAASPSPFIADLIELFPDRFPNESLLPSDSFVPAPDEIASWRDLRNVAFAEHGGSLRKGFAQEFGEIETAAELEQRRQSSAGFDHYDGILSDSKAIEQVAARYGPRHQFSANQIEAYAWCPFRFFVEHVLGITAAEAPAAEFDARIRGAILHETLQRFHEAFRGKAVADIPPDEAQEAMRSIVDEVFDRRARACVTAPSGVLVVEKLAFHKRMERYLRLERQTEDTQWKPMRFEVSFGKVPGMSQETLRGAEPFRLATGAGEVLLCGRVDRVDEARGECRLIDYKTRVHVQPKHITAGKTIQLVLYAMAAEAFLAPCAEAFFAEPGRSRKAWRESLGRGKSEEEWQARQAAACATIAETVSGLRTGRFPPIPYESACSCCPAGRVCRYETGRIERKQRASS